MNLRDQSGKASRWTYGSKSTNKPSAPSASSSARVSSSVGLAPEARSIWVIRLPTTYAFSPSSAWVSPAAILNLRTREPNSAAIDERGSISLAKTSLPFLTAWKVRLRSLPSVGAWTDP